MTNHCTWPRALCIVIAALLFSPLAALAAESYQLDPSFPRLPAGMKLGAVAGVATDSHGQVLVFHRGDPPLLVLDNHGTLLRSMGSGMFTSPHGLRVDREDNIWVTDNADHRVMKLSPDGKVLLTLGVRGKAGED